ncbi:MAG: multidrug efflux MFS transporter [Actinomycetia bacterium]|nr:multidrug efflux MFS transporter [Actinomycetes bacterium]
MLTSSRSRLSYETVVAVVYVAGMFMNIMDSTIVNTALPAIARTFRATPATADGVAVGYLLSLAVFIPASGWVGDRIGTKRTFLAALALFTAASALCGRALSLTELVLFRVIQGMGGGMLAPVGQAMLFRAFPPERRARASAVLMLATVLAPATGPVIGGWLVTDLSWRWVFYVNVPIGLAALLFGALQLREHREPAAGRFDLPGFALTGVGLPLVLYALSEGPRRGWTSPGVAASGIVGLLALVLLVRTEKTRPEPMLTLRLFRDRLFRTTNVVSFLGSAAFFGILFVMPQFLQEARGATALSSGLTTFPEAVGVILSSRVVGRLYHTVGPRRLMVTGLVWVSAAAAAMTRVDLATSPWLIRGLMFAVGVGWAGVVLPLQAASFARVSPADTGRAAALFNTQRQVASAVGVAVLATVLAARLPHAMPLPSAVEVPAFHLTFVVAAVLALAGAVGALGVRDADAAATMQPARSAGGARPRRSVSLTKSTDS